MSRRTEELSERSAPDLLDKKNVVGVAGGSSEILVLVERKEPLSALNEADVVNPRIEGVSTDVIEVGRIVPKNLGPGTSIGLANKGTGTLGARVVDEAGRVYALTNNHVAADSNRAMMLSAIHSPGPADGLGRRIGRLARAEPIYFDQDNLIDAALVAMDNEPISPLPERTTTVARVGWRVQKTGRTTGHTTGKVIARNATIDVNFGSQGVARFTNQIITDYMLDSGDSGSVVLSYSGFPVALGFAGSDTVSIHTPINLVLRTLAVKF